MRLLVLPKMAGGSVYLFSYLFILLLLINVVAEAALEHETTTMEDGKNEVVAVSKAFYRPRINCKFACGRRCSRTRRPNLCKRACGTCCFRCQCVPPGTYGNHNICPCYATLTTRGGRRKCP